jgi:hypothetical protein
MVTYSVPMPKPGWFVFLGKARCRDDCLFLDIRRKTNTNRVSAK